MACYDAFELKRCQIFATKIRRNATGFSLWKSSNNFKTHLESIDQDHTHFKTKPQSPAHLKPRKLMPIACFQLPMSKNYDFIKTKDCLRTSVVGCLTPCPHVTRLSNSRIKIFLPIHIIRKNNLFS